MSDELISQLSEFVARRIGLHFPRERWADLRRGACTAAQEFRYDDPAAFVQWLISTPIAANQIEILAGHLTVGETHFFRDPAQCEALDQFVLPELIRTRSVLDRNLRIWSAGCSSGEEPYSIAILLAKLIPDLRDWNVSILGTDINPRSLRKASEGSYSGWSFRDTPLWVKERYFKQNKQGRLGLRPEIKGMVTLASLNLAEDAYPALFNNTNAMDVILCRNVLMYFTPERAEKIVQHFHRSLVDGGWLIVSASEASHTLFSDFVTVNFEGATFYRKGENGVAAAAAADTVTRVLEERVFFQTASDSSGDSAGVNLSGRTFEESHPLESSSRVTDTEYEEAMSMYERGQYRDAVERIGALLADGRAEPKAMALLARIHANQGGLAEALEWCGKAIAADRLNPSFYYLRAAILEEQGRLEEAENCLKRVLYLDQDFVLAHFALGNLCERLGKRRQSLRHFQNALNLLGNCSPEQVLPEAEGITVARLQKIIRTAASVEFVR